MNKLYKVVETPGKINAHVWDESADPKYQFVEPVELTKEKIDNLLEDYDDTMALPALIVDPYKTRDNARQKFYDELIKIISQEE